MSSRTVSVVLSANIANYKANMAAAQKATEELAKTSQKTADGLQKQHQAFQTLGAGLVAVGATAAVAVGLVVKTTAEFSAKMAQLQTVSKATSSQMKALSDAALSQGKAFGYTASQVADAQIELAKAGIGAKQQLGGALTGALALAAAGQIEVGKATEIAVTALTDFKLTAADTGHVADLLASGADKSTASVESIGQALQQSGLVAAQFGLSVEDTVGTLTAFAQAGLQGSDAGTSLKTMLLSLASPSDQASKALSQYNITAYDSQGAFVGVTNLAEQLHDKLKDYSQEQRNAALATIFGTDAIRSAGVLYDLGGKKLQGFIDANNEAGFASAQAAGKLNSLTGDIQKLNATVQTDMIKAGSGVEGALRGIVQEADGVLTTFGNLPQGFQSTALVATALTAGVGLLGGAFLLAVPKIAEFRLALNSLGVSGKGAVGLFGKGAGIAVGLSAITSALANVATSGIASSEQIERAGNTMSKSFKNLNDSFKGEAFANGGAVQAFDAISGSFLGISQAGASKALDGLTFGITHFSDVYKSAEGQFTAIGEQLKGLAQQDYSSATSSFNQLVTQLGGGADATKRALTVVGPYRDQLIAMLTASGQAATEANILAAATGSGGVAGKLEAAQNAASATTNVLDSMSGAASSAAVDIDALAKQIAGFGSVTLDARSANRAFEQAVDDASEAAKKNGHNLDIATAAGRANQSALDGIASAATASAAALLRNGGSADDAAAAIKRGRAAFIAAATSMGLSKAAAGRLADSLNLIPRNVKTTIALQGGAAAQSQIADIKARMNNLNGTQASIYIKAVQTGASTGRAAQIAKNAGFADGGSVTGPGAKGRDSVYAMLAPGEHVLTAKDVDRMGGQAAVYNFRAGLQGYAGGGEIGGAKNAADKAKKDAARYAKQLKSAQAAEKAADKAYDAISGKEKDRAAKRAAKARADKASDVVDAIQKKLDAAKSAASNNDDKVSKLRDAREDFVSQQRRGVTDPLNYVDQLRSMSRDDNYSGKSRTKFDNAANKYESALVDLAKKSQDAADNLNDLTQSADPMRSSITSAIAGEYQATGGVRAGGTTKTGTIQRNGISYDVTSTDAGGGYSGSSLASYYAQGAADTGTFANQLQQLAARGVDGKLLAEIAGYGVKEGGPIAAALLSASGTEIASINSSYRAIQGNAAAGAGTVTDYNYKAAIDAAQKVADGIAKQIADDSAKLRKLIADAFGLKGYASGTDNATGGLHLVGEQGPELVRFAGGEQVMNSGRTQTWMRGNRYSNSGSNAAANGGDKVIKFHFTDDGSRLGSAMREIAEYAIARDQNEAAILEWGGAA